VIREPIEQRIGRALPKEEQRLELILRTRSRALGRRNRALGRCPGCGRAVLSDESSMNVGALVVHPECLFG
jgi:hypothetical protein